MYRDQDIEKYQSWTRSPATHKNSSLIIDSAVERLEQKSEEFALGIKEVLADVESGVSLEIKEYIRSLVSYQKDENHRNKLEARESWTQVFKQFSKQKSEIEKMSRMLLEQADNAMIQLGSYNDVLNFLHLEVKELRAENKNLHTAMRELKESLGTQAEQMQEMQDQNKESFRLLAEQFQVGLSEVMNVKAVADKKNSLPRKAGISKYARKRKRLY